MEDSSSFVCLFASIHCWWASCPAVEESEQSSKRGQKRRLTEAPGWFQAAFCWSRDLAACRGDVPWLCAEDSSPSVLPPRTPSCRSTAPPAAVVAAVFLNQLIHQSVSAQVSQSKSQSVHQRASPAIIRQSVSQSIHHPVDQCKAWMKLKLYPLQSGLPVCSLPTLRREGGGGPRYWFIHYSSAVKHRIVFSHRNISQSLTLSLSLKPVLSDLFALAQSSHKLVPISFPNSSPVLSQTSLKHVPNTFFKHISVT